MPDNKYQQVYDQLYEWTNRMAGSDRLKRHVRSEMDKIRDRIFADKEQGTIWVINDEVRKCPIAVYWSLERAKRYLLGQGYEVALRNPMFFSKGLDEMLIYEIVRVE